MGARALPQSAERERAITGVVAALPAEARSLHRGKLEVGQRIALAPTRWLQLAGMGRANAGRAAHALVQAGATRLLSWGIAGSLAPQLRAGALVLPITIVSTRQQVFAADTEWHSRVVQGLRESLTVTVEPLVESLEIVANVSDKRAMYAQSGASAVDMESAAIAEVAQQAGVPFLAIRAIVDDAERAIPQAALSAIDPNGRLRAMRFAKSLTGNPKQLPELITLARSLRAAQKTLARVAALAHEEL